MCMNFFRRNDKMNVNRGVARAAPRMPVIPPLYVPTIQVAKTCESGESKCNQPCKIEYIMLRGTELIHAPISVLIQNNVTCSKTRPGCGHTNLVSTLGVTQRDLPSSPPLPASF